MTQLRVIHEIAGRASLGLQSPPDGSAGLGALLARSSGGSLGWLLAKGFNSSLLGPPHSCLHVLIAWQPAAPRRTQESKAEATSLLWAAGLQSVGSQRVRHDLATKQQPQQDTTHHHFYQRLLARSKSLSPVHTQGRVLSKGVYQRVCVHIFGHHIGLSFLFPTLSHFLIMLYQTHKMSQVAFLPCLFPAVVCPREG